MHSCAMRRASPSSQGRCHDVRKHSLEQQPPRKPLLTQEDYFLVTQQALHQKKGAKCLCDSTNLPPSSQNQCKLPRLQYLKHKCKEAVKVIHKSCPGPCTSCKEKSLCCPCKYKPVPQRAKLFPPPSSITALLCGFSV